METPRRSSGPVVDELLEREQELDLLGTTLEKACAGGGNLVLVRGGAGAGKTALLQAAQVQAEARGMHVGSARGAEREREFPFGVVRQLLEPTVARMTREERARLFAGSASLARPLFSGRRQASPAGDPLALVEGLAWLIANLSRHVAPLLLCVDDVHWCDRTSLRALVRTALYLDELPVVIALAAPRNT